MSGTLEDLIQYRLEKANQTLEDAKLLANAKRWNPCVNRLYYACFYAVSALLAKNEFSSSKHACRGTAKAPPKIAAVFIGKGS
jgi:uncharacterized protein (UPF0332 family)